MRNHYSPSVNQAIRRRYKRDNGLVDHVSWLSDKSFHTFSAYFFVAYNACVYIERFFYKHDFIKNANYLKLPGADLDHVTYGLWRTKILPNCGISIKILEVLVLILILIQIWRTRKSFLNPPLDSRMCFSILFLILLSFSKNIRNVLKIIIRRSRQKW